MQNQEMMQETAFYNGLKVEIKTVKDDSQAQIEDIRAFIDRGVDLLIVSPNEAETLTPIVEEAFFKGIPVIIIERKISSSNYTAYVGGDNLEVGRYAGAYIAEYLQHKGNIIEIRGLQGSTSDTERHQGFMEEISKYPNLHIMGQYHADWYRDEAEKAMSDVLEKVPPTINLIFAMNDRMALGVYNALKNAGVQTAIVGIDGLPGKGNGIESILEEKITASVIYPTGGDKIIQIAMDILNGNPYKKENLLTSAVADKNNARVINMQYEQLLEHQQKLQRMNAMLDHSVALYSTQRMLLYAVILVLLLTGITLIVAFISYRSKNRANKLLAKQNEEIKKQAEELSVQKERLIQLSKELEEATHAKLVFFTNISHELKTPLSLILGPVQSLLKEHKLTDEQHELLGLTSRNSERLLNLISEIIEFRTYDNNKMKGYFSFGDLKSFLEELNLAFSDLGRQKNIQFKFICDGPKFEIWFDKEKMEKIYYNLLSNAFKFVNVNGEIRVNLKKTDDGFAQLSVFNTGSSISEEEANNIFNRFYKVNPHDAGTGIGLALTSALVEIHHGKIRVKSDENTGTTFIVQIPIVQESTEIETDTTPFYKNYTKSRISLDEQSLFEQKITDETFIEADKPLVLLVEDNADLRRFMYVILKGEYNIIEAENGKTGIKKAEKFIPDVIISDIMMPEKNGFELCKTLKENESTSHIPIIMLTACSLDEQKALGFESGADAYIEKPFDAGLLKIRLRKLIENREKIKKIFAGSLIDESKKTSLGELEQQFIDKFTKYVENNISNPELSVDDIAKQIGMSRVQLYRKIKSLTNLSPNELIRLIRLKQAKLLLASKTMSISEIAYKTGFSSPSYFSKCYKEFYKMSPSEI